MNGQRLILNWGYGGIDLNGITYYHSGVITAVAVLQELVVIVFDQNKCDPRVTSPYENVLCFNRDQSIAWKLDLGPKRVDIGPIGGIASAYTTGNQIYFWGKGPTPQQDCIIELKTGKLIAAKQAGR